MGPVEEPYRPPLRGEQPEPAAGKGMGGLCTCCVQAWLTVSLHDLQKTILLKGMPGTNSFLHSNSFTYQYVWPEKYICT
jgi:hypothetical protein